MALCVGLALIQLWNAVFCIVAGVGRAVNVTQTLFFQALLTAAQASLGSLR